MISDYRRIKVYVKVLFIGTPAKLISTNNWVRDILFLVKRIYKRHKSIAYIDIYKNAQTNDIRCTD